MTNRQQLRIYRTLDELQNLRAAWDQLLAQYPPATMFSSWEWLTNWWYSFGDHRRLLVLALFESDSLVGLAPLSISHERFAGFPVDVLRMMADGSYDSDNLDFPALPGYEQALADAVLRYLPAIRNLWDICLLNTLPPDSLSAERVANRLQAREWITFERSTPSSAIQLAPTWEEYRSNLATEDQRNLPRYLRRLRRYYSTRIFRCTEPDDLDRCLQGLFRLHQARWQKAGQPGSFSSAKRRKFYAGLSRCLLERGALEFWILELDGQIAGAQFAFRYNDRVFQLQEGYDPERSSDRVGYVLRGEVIKQLISEGVRVYDFLGGEDSYKSRWGARTGHYREFHFARPWSWGGLLLWSSEQTRKYKELMRQNLPGAMKLLRKVRCAIQTRIGGNGDFSPGILSESRSGNGSCNLDRSASISGDGQVPEHGTEVA